MLFRSLNLDPMTAAGKKGKWLHNMIPGWETYLQNLERAGVLLRSQQYMGAERVDMTRCLPWPSVTSCGLLALCVRLMSPVPDQGGLHRSAARDSIRAFLQHLLSFMSKDPWQVTVFITEDIRMAQHPQPTQRLSCQGVAMTVDTNAGIEWPVRPFPPSTHHALRILPTRRKLFDTW